MIQEDISAFRLSLWRTRFDFASNGGDLAESQHLLYTIVGMAVGDPLDARPVSTIGKEKGNWTSLIKVKQSEYRNLHRNCVANRVQPSPVYLTLPNLARCTALLDAIESTEQQQNAYCWILLTETTSKGIIARTLNDETSDFKHAISTTRAQSKDTLCIHVWVSISVSVEGRTHGIEQHRKQRIEGQLAAGDVLCGTDVPYDVVT